MAKMLPLITKIGAICGQVISQNKPIFKIHKIVLTPSFMAGCWKLDAGRCPKNKPNQSQYPVFNREGEFFLAENFEISYNTILLY
jgi:hypothetical protein